MRAKLSEVDPSAYVTLAAKRAVAEPRRRHPALRPHLICLDSDSNYSLLCLTSKRRTASTYVTTANASAARSVLAGFPRVAGGFATVDVMY